MHFFRFGYHYFGNFHMWLLWTGLMWTGDKTLHIYIFGIPVIETGNSIVDDLEYKKNLVRICRFIRIPMLDPENIYHWTILSTIVMFGLNKLIGSNLIELLSSLLSTAILVPIFLWGLRKINQIFE